MQKNLKNNYKKIFKGKRVLITGHTGFKGSWLSLWMHLLELRLWVYQKYTYETFNLYPLV